ncbi:MAG: hypothetical protein AB1489_00770 [Acidobacteriota bacterium]
MGLAQLQKVLAQLYTDAALRKEFFTDPQTTAPMLGLSVAEAMQLVGLCLPITRFAHSLHHKRRDEAGQFLYFTQRALGAQFDTIFLEYANSYLPEGINKPREDAIAFVAFLERTAPIHYNDIQPWIIEVARYEADRLIMQESGKHWQIRLFFYPISEILQNLAAGVDVPQMQRRFVVALWWRTGNQSPLQQRLWQFP